jgi:glycolate oxidase iron-sulfur subunit
MSLSADDALYDELLICSRCGTCLPACPSYGATLLETHSPRGRIQLLRAVSERRLEIGTGLQEALSACLDCRACESVCPNGVHPGQVSVRRRAEIQPRGGMSGKLLRFVLGTVLAHPGWMETGMGGLRACYQRTGLQARFRSGRLARALPRAKRIDGYLPPLPARSVRQSLPPVVQAVGVRRGTIGFFVGCAMNTLFAETTVRSIRALSRLGYDVVLPRDVVCCGAPHVSLGEPGLARKMARHNLACFDGVEAIVTDCAACGAELKHYPELLDDASAEGFATRVQDFSEFVAPRLPSVSLRPGAVTYHAPCHLAHAQHLTAAPEKILMRTCADYRPLREQDRCCGSAGVYWLQHPEIAEDALQRKLANIRATGATTVVTANPGCILHLAAGRSATDTWNVVHVSELVEEALAEERND